MKTILTVPKRGVCVSPLVTTIGAEQKLCSSAAAPGFAPEQPFASALSNCRVGQKRQRDCRLDIAWVAKRHMAAAFMSNCALRRYSIWRRHGAALLVWILRGLPNLIARAGFRGSRRVTVYQETSTCPSDSASSTDPLTGCPSLQRRCSYALFLNPTLMLEAR